MMKVAIVGTNGLAQHITNFISTTTAHQFVVLSRRASPGLASRGWQILICDYSNQRDLQFKLAGADTVISTISGSAQLALIDAAAAVHVRRFVPSEFAGRPSLRPVNDPFDQGRRAALLRLAQHEPSGMRFTVLACGIFYERFAPTGMANAAQIGLTSHIGQEGAYILDYRRAQAEVPYYSIAGRPVYICMTSARDVARFIVAALDLPSWPREFRLRGERLSLDELLSISEQVRGQVFERTIYTRESLQDALTYARAVRNSSREGQLNHLMATAEGQYDFENVNLNQILPIQPERFHQWLARVWS